MYIYIYYHILPYIYLRFANSQQKRNLMELIIDRLQHLRHHDQTNYHTLFITYI